jgi:DNA-binding NtrC family response regulator
LFELILGLIALGGADLTVVVVVPFVVTVELLVESVTIGAALAKFPIDRVKQTRMIVLINICIVCFSLYKLTILLFILKCKYIYTSFNEVEIKMNNNDEQNWIMDQMNFLGGTVREQSLATEVAELEHTRIEEALIKHSFNRTHTALELGIGRTLLIHKIKKYNLFK